MHFCDHRAVVPCVRRWGRGRVLDHHAEISPVATVGCFGCCDPGRRMAVRCPAPRAFPMLDRDEFQVPRAGAACQAARFRPAACAHRPAPPPSRPCAKADEMGDAITARGGTGQLSRIPSKEPIKSLRLPWTSVR